jgi:hypothetical protein
MLFKKLYVEDSHILIIFMESQFYFHIFLAKSRSKFSHVCSK